MLCNCDGDVAVPGRPEDVTATNVMNGSTTLTWSAPQYDGGSPVTGYNVEMYSGSGWNMINEKPITACRIDIDDLVEGTQNEFRVRAENEVGLGPPSVSTLVEVEYMFQVPGRPDPPVVTRRTKHEATLAFKAPDDDGGSPVTGYIVEMKTKSESKWKVAGKDIVELEFVARGLKPSLEYEFRVIAVNVAGPGQPSLPSEPPSKYGNYTMFHMCNQLC